MKKINSLKNMDKPQYEQIISSIAEMNNAGYTIEQISDTLNISKKIVKDELNCLYENSSNYIIKKPISIKKWEPENFKQEATTVWSFPNRGGWATHYGNYRGNWSPYIPRNIILRYSNEGDIILDQFVGSGTTLVETKLLNRVGIGVDINPNAINITNERLDFKKDNTIQPHVHHGDARNLSAIIGDKSIDLICTHPPYANIIKYSEDIEGDLSHFDIDEFIHEMNKVANECFRVLKSDKYCAILIGDTRRKKHMVPLGFNVMQVFLNAGFLLKETIIKEQHNCKATGFWYTRSIDMNFLLIAHEYLFIFRKP